MTSRRPTLGLTVTILLALTLATDTQAATLRVNRAGGPYFHIADAVADAANHDTIEVAPGIYPELLVIHDKRLAFVSTGGPEDTILDGEERRRLLRCFDSQLSFTGFTFQDGRGTSGGAIAATDSELIINDCVFRHNEATGAEDFRWRTYGGAIFASRNSQAVIRGSSFIENTSRGGGGAIGHSSRDWAGDPENPDRTGWDVRFTINGCSFIRNTTGNGSQLDFDAASASWVQHSLFTGTLNRGVFISRRPAVRCCIFWDADSPQLDESGRAAAPLTNFGEDNFVIDPMLCPDDPERVHASSPTRYLCDGIGATAVGCSDPIILARRPRDQISPRVDQAISVYGYGLDAVDSAQLLHTDGTIVDSKSVDHDGVWLRFGFDLTATKPGPWSLLLRTNAEEIVRIDDAYILNSIDPRRFRPAWIAEDQPRRVQLILAEARGDLDLLLVAPDQTQIPITNNGATATDTLSVDLPALTPGIYDLIVRDRDGAEYLTEIMLRVGEPRLHRVPGEYPSVKRAIAAAEPGDEIRIAAGYYPESLTIDIPLRLIGEGAQYWDTRLDLETLPGQRGIHVLASAGHIVEIENLYIRKARWSDGPGAGIYAEVPVRISGGMVANCQTAGENAMGGGIWAAPGSEIIGTRVHGNGAYGDESTIPADPIADPSAGTGGGLFCLDCRVEDCEFGGNSAHSCSEVVVDGVFLRNTLETQVGSGGSDLAILGFALRGRIEGNQFANSCGTGPTPFGVFLGPSKVRFNTFTDFWWDLCHAESMISLHGPIEFSNNSLAGVALQVCRQHQFADPEPGPIRITNNLIQSFAGPGMTLDLCEDRLSPGLVHNIPRDQVEFDSNLGYGIVLFGSEGADDCDNCIIPMEDVGFCSVVTYRGYEPYGEFDLRLTEDSPALPNNEPFTADTLGARQEICTVLPVFVRFVRVERTDEGVALEWSLSADVSIVAVGIERRENSANAVAERLDPEWLHDCHSCSYLDREAQADRSYEYTALVLYPSGETERVTLGTVSEGRLPTQLSLGLPSPNPAQDGAFAVRFTTPTQSHVVLEFVDAAGRRVETLWDGPATAGTHTVRREATAGPLPGGVYWLRLRDTSGRAESQRLVVLR